MEFEMYQKSAAFIKRRLGSFTPEILLILGSGLGSLGDSIPDAVTIPYEIGRAHV